MKTSLMLLPCLFLTCAVGPARANDSKDDSASKAEEQRPNKPPRRLFGYTDTELLPGQKWRVHDAYRPEPPVITPGTPSTQKKPGKPPSDAIVLFDGTDLSQWESQGGGPAKWKVADGYMEVNGTGSIRTREGFGSCQLHVEWATPSEVEGSGQGRGNSGVMIMGLYEIQVLDSYNNRTYSDGQAAAIYGQYPPMVNASRPPGHWQTYDIIFEAPEFEDGKVVKPAYVTVLHNGVVVHHHTKILGRVQHKFLPFYQPHGEKEPLLLQDHGNPVRYRNIWIRPLTGYDSGAPVAVQPVEAPVPTGG